MLDPLAHLSSHLNTSLSPGASPSPLRLLLPASLHPFLLLSYPLSHSAPASASSSATAALLPSTATASASVAALLRTVPSEHPSAAYLRSLLALTPSLARQFSYPQAIAHARSSASAGLGAAAQTAQRTLYGKGSADVAFVAFCAIAFTVVRHLAMRYVFATFARGWLVRRDRGLRAEVKRKRAERSRARRTGGAGAALVDKAGGADKVETPKPMGRRKREMATVRFSEQAWTAVYATCSWSLGLLILSRLPAPLSPQSFWASYPVTHLPGLSKFYYLAQLGWWFHQIYVINAEKRRADHWQMFAHHCLTIALIVASYLGNLTRIGTVLHVLMDAVDILLCSAKCFRYLGLTTLCDATFVAFLGTWLVTRQIGLPYLIYTTATEPHRMLPMLWQPDEGLYFTRPIRNGFVVAMSLLLLMCTVWFGMAVKVAVRVVRGQGAEDSRSDDEGEEGEEGEEETSGAGSGAEEAIEAVPSKGDAGREKGTGSKERHAPAHAHASAGASASKALHDIAERVGCKRDTLKEEAVRRRR